MGVEHALIGGLAVSRHGLPRPTRDVDFLVSLPKVRMPELLRQLAGTGFQVDEIRAIRELSQDGLTRLPFRSSAADLMMPILPFIAKAISRAETVPFEGQPLRIVRAEDLLALKTVALRETDRRDIEGIVASQQERLDLGMLEESLSQVTMPGDEKREFLDSVLERYGLPRLF